MLARRFEFKYVIPETHAKPIFEFVRLHLSPDKYTPEGYTDGYPVHSLYLDSADLHTCKATQQGHKNRFKLRIRFYDDDPSKPVFFEIKRRDSAVILKQRAMVKREFVEDLAQGAPPEFSQLYRDDLKNWKSLYEFCRLRDLISARPAAYTSYMRAGYEHPGSNTVRVTLDRRIRAGRFTGRLTATGVREWPLIYVPGVVLELKFTDSFPNWMHELTQVFNLKRGSMPKYVECVTLVNDL